MITYIPIGMQDNPMYVSAGPREQAAGASGSSAVYSKVDKHNHVADSNKNDVYAQVDKSRKTKESNNLSVIFKLTVPCNVKCW